MSYDDPLQWDREAQRCFAMLENYEAALHDRPSELDESGPYIGVPLLSTREAFQKIRALPEALPLREPLLRWAYRIADGRVNGELLRQLALRWRVEMCTVDVPRRSEHTRAQMLMRVLGDLPKQKLWFEALSRSVDGLTEGVSLLWQRRQELAERAGFSSMNDVADPCDDFPQQAKAWLGACAPLAEEMWSRHFSSYLRAAQAGDAVQGWPALMTAHSVAQLLGERQWLARATVREPRWPLLMGPTSFVRALDRLGHALGRAWASSSHPFVLAHEPYDLAGHRLGALVASLVLSPAWHRRVLGVREDRARAQVRALATSFVAHGHALCLRVLSAHAARTSVAALRLAFSQVQQEHFGFELPSALAGVVPQIQLGDAQRLLGFWWGLADHARLRQSFDSDWFRNPRAVEMLLEQSGTLQPARFETTMVTAQHTEARRWLLECLEQ